MWDVSTGDMIYSLDGMFSFVHSVCFDSTGLRLAVGSEDKGVTILDAADGSIVHTLEGHEVMLIYFILFYVFLCFSCDCSIAQDFYC
jgi:WD40 repeat protein